MFALTVSGFGAPAQAGADPDNAVDSIKTATPIKHVIIIVGENRSFDHLFATYLPKRKSEKVLNLLSEGIVNADVSPGPNFAKAHQFKIVSAPNGGKFFSSADLADKELYSTLPAPDVAGVPAVSPDTAVLKINCEPKDRSAKPTLTARITVEPTNQVFTVRVTFAIPPEVEKQIPKSARPAPPPN